MPAMPESNDPPIVGNASARPSWDPARGRANRMPSVPTPFEALDTPFRIRRALEQSAFAAGFIAVSNALSAVIDLFSRTSPHTLIGSDPRVLAGVQTCAALAAAYLAVRSRRRPGLGLAIIILIWSIIEAFPWVPYKLYGHGFAGHGMGAVMWLVVAAAILGVRGALAQRKMSAAPLGPA